MQAQIAILDQYLVVDRCLLQCELRPSTVQFIAQNDDASVNLCVLQPSCSMDNHDEEKRIEQNLFVRSGINLKRKYNKIALDLLRY